VTLVVQKFGGTSVADLDRLRAVAQRIQRARAAGEQIATVVSAMAGTTDRLADWARQIGGPGYDRAEYDTVVASGEQITAGLLALALQALGVPARSILGWQAPLLTDGSHSRARIRSFGTEQVRACLDQGQVVVVPGFQGISPDGRVTTLGRGGSDLSAVALAAALGASRCDIFTDVEGVYTTDPRIVAKAHKLERFGRLRLQHPCSAGRRGHRWPRGQGQSRGKPSD
jgi:aspartate kinase